MNSNHQSCWFIEAFHPSVRDLRHWQGSILIELKRRRIKPPTFMPEVKIPSELEVIASLRIRSVSYGYQDSQRRCQIKGLEIFFEARDDHPHVVCLRQDWSANYLVLERVNKEIDKLATLLNCLAESNLALVAGVIRATNPKDVFVTAMELILQKDGQSISFGYTDLDTPKRVEEYRLIFADGIQPSQRSLSPLRQTPILADRGLTRSKPDSAPDEAALLSS